MNLNLHHDINKTRLLPLPPHRYLEMAFSPSSGIRKQDALTVFSVVATNDVGGPLAWTFLQNRWDDLHDL